jgi:hypothetical protein
MAAQITIRIGRRAESALGRPPARERKADEMPTNFSDISLADSEPKRQQVKED